MQTHIITSLDRVDAADWNRLVPNAYPFLRHEFLNALETQGCLQQRSGWPPQHVICQDQHGRLLGAVPLYLKDNSFGEFVFDWSWANAYRQYGLDYYPKLVAAIPFTPATGPRWLLPAGGTNRDAIAAALIQSCRSLAYDRGCSSLHWLFPDHEHCAHLERAGFLIRTGCQFHWHNRGYPGFEDFLGELVSKRRKNIRRERKLASTSRLQIVTRHGSDLSATDWLWFHRFYCNTFHQRGNFPALTLEFFRQLGATLGERVLVVTALMDHQPVAAALSYLSHDTLYGRHWGCAADFDSLHFELCYYQGIEYCIRHGLTRFEPGAQGEHKIWRGFLPTLTYSAHWLADPQFNIAVADFLARETPAVQAYAEQLQNHNPYRDTPP